MSMKIGLFTYCQEKMDVQWNMLTKCRDHRARLSARFCEEQERSVRLARLADIQDFENFYWSAIDAARQMGSEGNFLVEPHIGFIPTTRSLTTYIVWKDDDHGSTYLVSPVEMPWLAVGKDSRNGP